jgi:hypothetical protein
MKYSPAIIPVSTSGLDAHEKYDNRTEEKPCPES